MRVKQTAIKDREIKYAQVRNLKMLDEEQGIFEGYLAVFSNVDEDGDEIQPGAFKKTLNEHEQKRRVTKNPYLFPVLWNHIENEPIGGCLAACEDQNGLYVKCQLDLNVQRGREVRSGLKLGYIGTMSIGYNVIKRSYKGSTRLLQELMLWEGSVVTFPANPLAMIDRVSVKKGQAMPPTKQPKARGKANVKAVDFAGALSRQTEDLQEQWADVWRAFVYAIATQMWDYGVEDKQSAVAAVVKDFGDELDALVEKSQAAQFCPMLDDDSDSFADPDEDDDQYSETMSMRAHFGRKAGRAISAANTDRMTKALDMIDAGHKDLRNMIADQSSSVGHDDDDPGEQDPDGGKDGKSRNQGAGNTTPKDTKNANTDDADLASFRAYMQSLRGEMTA